MTTAAGTPTQTPKTFVTFQVPVELVDRFDELAKQRERSRSAELRLAMAERIGDMHLPHPERSSAA